MRAGSRGDIMLLQIQDGSLSIGGQSILSHFSFEIKGNEKIALVGRNGSGKTTLLRLLAGELSLDRNDQNPSARIITSRKLTIGLLRQQAFSDVSVKVEEELLKACPCPDKWDRERFAWEQEYDRIFTGFGLKKEDKKKPLSRFSGGEQTKIALIRLLLEQPDILLLDEPTNHLDMSSISWLETYLLNYKGAVIIVSHDRYFLNKVCTHIADIDYGKIQLYAGNYDFWYESSQLMIRQMKEANKKKEEKIKELQEFISRFSANASKSRQATSRKKALEKIQLDEIRPSSRKYPYIDFRPNREIGNEVLTVEGISKTIDGVKVLDNISFILGHDDKVAFVGSNEFAKTTLFKILSGEMEPDEGSYKWGVTTSQSYFPKDNTKEFDNDDIIVDWLTQYSEIKDVTYVRGFLGRMLFAGEDGVKKVRILSGGEKVRCMLSKLMISGANVLILDEPTDHLDMEAITALNNGMIKFPGVLLFSSRDHQIVQTTANRIIELLPNGSMVDKITTYDEYLESDEMARKRTIYTSNKDAEDDN